MVYHEIYVYHKRPVLSKNSTVPIIQIFNEVTLNSKINRFYLEQYLKSILMARTKNQNDSLNRYKFFSSKQCKLLLVFHK